jgi:hypothetical protein
MMRLLVSTLVTSACTSSECPPPPPTKAPETFTFHCITRTYGKNWDGRNLADIELWSNCSTQEQPVFCNQRRDFPTAWVEEGRIELQSRCFETAHAFCFAFLIPDPDPKKLEVQFVDLVRRGSGSCFLSWDQCLREWKGIHEGTRFDEEGQRRAEESLTKTQCRLF